MLQRYQPDVRRYAKRHCLSSDVEDAIQESLIILSRNVSAIRMVAALSGWLFKVDRAAQLQSKSEGLLNFDR